MTKLTKRIVDAAEPTPTITYIWDGTLSGFGLKVLTSGAKKYVVKYRVGGGRQALQRWVLLGSHGALTCEQARAMAQQVLADVARGLDPQKSKLQQRDAPRLIDVWQRFETEQLPKKKPSTQHEYRSQWRDILSPLLGTRLVGEISRAEIDRLHKSLSEAPYRANRVLALCSRLMSLAEGWEWRQQGTNPCRYVERHAEKPRTRYLTSSELGALGTALEDVVDVGDVQASAANAVKLLLLTGARLNELLTARWDWIDKAWQVLSLPDSKTGAKPIYLGDAARHVLRQQNSIAVASNSPYIFPGRSGGKHMINLRKPWTRICEKAGISGVRLHDLRHTAASVAVGRGASLAVIGRLLGHSQAQTTQRYAHVDADPALRAANEIGLAIGGFLHVPAVPT